MIRASRSDAAGRAFRAFTRATIAKVNDRPKMQEVDVNLLQDEKKESVERWQNYGFSSVPHGPSSGKHAEALVAFLGGNRSHAAVVAIDDRRHRPKDLRAGESVIYDDQKQRILVGRDGIRISGGDSELPLHIDVGGTKFRFTKDSIEMTVGGKSFKIDGDGFHFTGGALDHDGKKIDKTHKHTGVTPGAGLTGVPE